MPKLTTQNFSNKFKSLICCSNYSYARTTSYRKAKCSKLSENEAKLSLNIESKLTTWGFSNKFELLICCSTGYYGQTITVNKAKCLKLSENEAKPSLNIEIKTYVNGRHVNCFLIRNHPKGVSPIRNHPYKGDSAFGITLTWEFDATNTITEPPSLRLNFDIQCPQRSGSIPQGSNPRFHHLKAFYYASSRLPSVAGEAVTDNTVCAETALTRSLFSAISDISFSHWSWYINFVMSLPLLESIHH
jgi:hypothetical protein